MGRPCTGERQLAAGDADHAVAATAGVADSGRTYDRRIGEPFHEPDAPSSTQDSIAFRETVSVNKGHQSQTRSCSLSHLLNSLFIRRNNSTTKHKNDTTNRRRTYS